MVKKSLILMLIGLLVVSIGTTYGKNIKTQFPEGTKKASIQFAPLMSGDEKIGQAFYHPTLPRLVAGSPGDTVGSTQYEYQSNGSTGNRIAVDSQNGIHFAWMNGINFNSGVRRIYYNFYGDGGWGWPNTGEQASQTQAYYNGTGYTQIAVNNSDAAVIAYHKAPGILPPGQGQESTWVAIDGFRGNGSFTYHRSMMRTPGDTCIWPYVTVDRGDRIHVVGTSIKPTNITHGAMEYIRSTDGGATFTAPQIFDTTGTTSVIVTSSPVSDKVAIVYTRSFPYAPYDTINNGNGQWYDDVYYIQSTDGVTWDFTNGKHNITDYYNDDDSLAAYTDCDAVYDYNDNLHIIWSALPQTDSGLYYLTYLEHYSTGTGTINHICKSDSTWPHSPCGSDSSMFGVWNWSIAKMSIGVDPQNDLFATFTSWYSNDLSANGCSNGEIFLSYSNDNGATWTLKGDLTNSHTDSCLAGDCDSDHWSSLAEKVDSHLHLFFVNDKDAGGIAQSEGSVTDNPMLYLAYPNPVQGQAAPDAPALVFPTNGMSFTEGYAVFEWGEPVGVLHYAIQVDTSNSFGSPIMADNNVTGYQWINPDSMVVDTYYWRVKAVGLFGESAWGPTWSFTVNLGGCPYVLGDINGNGSPDAVDVTYGVNYLKGRVTPPNPCDMCPETAPFYASGDVNGSCEFNGIDITFFVNYLKGRQPALIPCADCMPAAR